MNSTRDRVISLLGQGFAANVVASTLGVSPGWISQLMDEDTVREEVARLSAGRLEDKLEADNEVDSLEKASLKLLKEKMSFVRTPVEAAKIFSMLNRANRKTATSVAAEDAMSAQTVTFTIPRAASILIQVNAQNQVIDVGGQTMATLPSRALPALAAARKAEQLEHVEVVPAQAAVSERLKKEDADRAEKLLDGLAVIIDGVECVL